MRTTHHGDSVIAIELRGVAHVFRETHPAQFSPAPTLPEQRGDVVTAVRESTGADACLGRLFVTQRREDRPCPQVVLQGYTQSTVRCGGLPAFPAGNDGHTAVCGIEQAASPPSLPSPARGEGAKRPSCTLSAEHY
jgi:hypothetical protein